MKFSSGEIYFIGEYDVKTGMRSEYFKVGIVRHGGKDNRSSLDRLLEHQTGNPRRLDIVYVLEADAVEAIETSLHHMYAPHRVYGEWLKLDETLFEGVKRQAEQLKADMSQYRSIFELAESLQETISQEEKSISTVEADYWFDKYCGAHVREQACTEVISEYKLVRIKEVEQGKDVDEFIRVQNKAGRRRFDIDGFKKKYPDLYKQFSTQNPKIRGSFRPINSKIKELSLFSVDSKLEEKILSFREALGRVGSLESQCDLHNQFLAIESELAFAEWEKDLAVAHLKNLCGGYEGIQGICTWKRVSVMEEKLDEKALKDAFPEVVEEFISIGNETKSYALETRSAYLD